MKKNYLGKMAYRFILPAFFLISILPFGSCELLTGLDSDSNPTPVSLVSVLVTKLPGKTIYCLGESFESTGLEIIGSYSDNTTKLETGYILSAVNTGTTGTKTVTVSLNGKTASFEITVNTAALVSIAVTQNPVKTAYYKGEELDLIGLIVTGSYTDSSTQTESVTVTNISGFDKNTVSTQTLTVTINGKTATFTVTVNPAALVSIAVTTAPAKSVYATGETFESAGLQIIGTYTDDTTKSETGYTLSPVDTSTTGTKTVTISLNGKTTAFEITVNVAALVSIAVTQNSVKTAYYKGEELDLTGLIVTGTYTDSSTQTESVTTANISGFDKNTVSTQTLTVTVNGKTATFTVTVNPAALVSIAVTTVPAKSVYATGETFESAGLQITGTYTDNTTQLETGYTLSPVNTGTIGAKTITVSFNGKTTTFEITVNTAALVSIAVTQAPTKTVYAKGEELDITGLGVTGTYTDSSTQTETVTAANITGFNKNTVSAQTLTVTVNGKTTTFNITVNPAALASIAVTQNPAKTVYAKGEELNLAGLVVTGTYTDSSTKTETVTMANISGFNKNTVSTQTLTVTINGKTATFTVTVNPAVLVSIAVTQNPIKTIYATGEELDLTGLAVTGTYTDSTTQTETVTAANITGFNKNTVSTQTLTVTINGKTATFNITVNATLVSIAVTQNPVKTIYVTGEELDLTGLIVTGTYTDNTTKPETTYTVSTIDINSTGTKNVTVSLNGKTASFDVSFMVPTYGISHNVTGTLTFPAVAVGYGGQTGKDVTISNTGNQATGSLTVALSGTNSGSFTLSQTAISSIAAGKIHYLSVVPKTGLAIGTYNATVTVSGGNGITASFNVSFMVTPSVDFGFMGITFAEVIEGYGAPNPFSVSISNTGNQATGALTVALSGTDSGSFTLSNMTIPSIPGGSRSSGCFTVVPKTGLAVGTYNATVTVNWGSSILDSFYVKFMVKSANCSITLDVTTCTFEVSSNYVETAKSITITNTGILPTGPLTVSLPGYPYNAYFSLSRYTIPSIAVGESDTFTVILKPGCTETDLGYIRVSGEMVLTQEVKLKLKWNY
jgi:acetoacetate decarboxylase